MSQHGLRSLQGKNVLIGGGTTGIGRATAVRLAEEGASVFIFGRHEQELDDAMQDIRDVGGSVNGTVADQAEQEGIAKVISECERQLGRLDVLITCAAVAAGSITDMGFEEIEYAVRDNLLGYMALTQAALPLFEGEGHIVSIGSMSAKAREADSDVYVATKSGIRGFTDSLAKKINQKKIRVTLVEPGLVGTDLLEMSAEEQRNQEESMYMLKAEDVAEAIFFAVSQPLRCNVSLIQLKPLLQAI